MGDIYSLSIMFLDLYFMMSLSFIQHILLGRNYSGVVTTLFALDLRGHKSSQEETLIGENMKREKNCSIIQ